MNQSETVVAMQPLDLSAQTVSNVTIAYIHDTRLSMWHHHQLTHYVPTFTTHTLQQLFLKCCATAASSIVRKRRLGLFGHVARFADDVPANQILQTCCKAQDGVRSSPDWRHAWGRPLTTWIHQIRWDTGILAGASSRASWTDHFGGNSNGGMLWLIASRHDDDDDDAIAKMTVRCALYIGYSTLSLFTPTSTTLLGSDSEQI